MGAFLLAVKTGKDDVRRCEAVPMRREVKKEVLKKYGHMAAMRVDGEFFLCA